jgi:hypothetical protein
MRPAARSARRTSTSANFSASLPSLARIARTIQGERDARVCGRQPVLDILPMGGKAILDARRFDRQPILHALPLANDFRPHVSDELLKLLPAGHRRGSQ